MPHCFCVTAKDLMSNLDPSDQWLQKTWWEDGKWLQEAGLRRGYGEEEGGRHKELLFFAQGLDSFLEMILVQSKNDSKIPSWVTKACVMMGELSQVES